MRTFLNRRRFHDPLEPLTDDRARRFPSTCKPGNIQTELVSKENYAEHIQGLRPGSGTEILGRIERARDGARAIVAQEIRCSSEARLDRGERTGAGHPADARRDGGIQRSAPRDAQEATGRADAQLVRLAGGVRRGAGILAGTRRPYQGDGRRGSTLEGLPARINVDDASVIFASFKPAQNAARA